MNCPIASYRVKAFRNIVLKRFFVQTPPQTRGWPVCMQREALGRCIPCSQEVVEPERLTTSTTSNPSRRRQQQCRGIERNYPSTGVVSFGDVNKRWRQTSKRSSSSKGCQVNRRWGHNGSQALSSPAGPRRQKTPAHPRPSL